MALPLSRNTNYVADAEVKSVDLNALQDSVIAGLHGATTRIILPSEAQMVIGAFPAVAGDFWTNANGDRTGNVGHVVIPVPLLVGEVITAVKVRGADVDATHKFYGQLFVRDIVGTARTAKSTQIASSGAGAIQAIDLTNITAIALVAGYRYEIDFVVDAGAGAYYGFYSAEVVISKST